MSVVSSSARTNVSASELVVPDVRDYWELLKPRVMSLAVFTAAIGLLLAPDRPHPVLACAAILFTAIGAGAAGCLNMWFESDLDSRMKRTRSRPIPAGKMERGAALGFGLTLAIAAVTLMALFINLLAASLLMLSIIFYILVYTAYLKLRTPHNIVIGGAAGALPPVIGWAAATNTVSLFPVLLFAIIFVWTPAHFWALALSCKDDYARAGVPMLPVVAGLKSTHLQIFIYSLLCVVTSLLPVAFGLSGVLYALVAGVLGAIFVMVAWRLLRHPSLNAEKRVFFFSIIYLFFLFTALLVDKILKGAP